MIVENEVASIGADSKHRMPAVAGTRIFDRRDQQGAERPTGLGEQPPLQENDVFAIAAVERISPALDLSVEVCVAGPFHPIICKRVDREQLLEKIGSEDDVARCFRRGPAVTRVFGAELQPAAWGLRDGAERGEIAMGSYLILHDAVGDQLGTVGQASLMNKYSSTTYFPKPAANVFKMFAMMTGTRRAVTVPTANPNLGAFAASDANAAGVVIFNYNSAFTDTPATFSVEVDNLPYNGVVLVERYLVDANTSNLEAYLTQPGQPDPTLQRVEQFSALVQNGQLFLPSRTLRARRDLLANIELNTEPSNPACQVANSRRRPEGSPGRPPRRSGFLPPVQRQPLALYDLIERHFRCDGVAKF